MIGIIAEYNPFHNGHLYHLKKVQEMFPNETITLVLAGNFLNRGDISIINKWDKTKLALEYGIDLVVELPFVFATQAADIYAYGAIQILDDLQCDYLVFGSELNNISILSQLADIELHDNYQEALHNYLKKGFNYPTSLAKALKEITNIEIKNPNDLLGLSYIKAIKKIHSKIKPISIKRTNDYHSIELNNPISSASSIRKALQEEKDISSYVPSKTQNYIHNVSLNDYFSILKHQIIIAKLTNYQDIDEKLEQSLKKHIMHCQNIEELITCVKSKNYTYNKIKRCLIHILCGMPKDNYSLSYIRILGFNDKGQSYLNKIKKHTSLPLITNYNKMLDLELQVTKIYSLVYPIDYKSELQKPIIKSSKF